MSTSARNRHVDAQHATPAPPPVPVPSTLPAVDWVSIGATAPEALPVGDRQPDDPLPAADIVLITWTSAEWLALNHVFCDSGTTTPIHGSSDWQASWSAYTRGAASYQTDEASSPLWGSFRLCRIVDAAGTSWRVLLFKSNTHLAHPPWITGLTAMTQAVLHDTGAERLYTIGTAGGPTVAERLGDCVVANIGIIELQCKENTAASGNGEAYRCPDWFPNTDWCEKTARHLLIPMSSIATNDVLEALVDALKRENHDDPAVRDITVDDLVNDAIRPSSLTTPRILPRPDVPILTTDYYYVASGDNSTAYSFLEMDDTVLGREANALGRKWTAVRNISDPIVPDTTSSGTPIAATVQSDWSSLVYSTFGVFTSFNGALAAWSTIAGGTG